MKAFAALYARVDQSTRTGAKVAALVDYLRHAPESDRLWCIALFTGRRPRRAVTTTQLRDWAATQAGLAPWLLEESYAIVGDLAETIALILPPPRRATERSLTDWIALIRSLAPQDEAARRAAILDAWDGLDGAERFLFNKLLTGGFRVGVSTGLVTRALAEATDQPPADIALRLMGNWTPDTVSYQSLITDPAPAADLSRPYPFYLCHPLDDLADLGDPDGWAAEHKWDGIRGQFILRGGTHHLWSRGEELMTDRFPELATLRDWLPDGTVIDGEVLAWRDDAPLPFARLQQRIGRKTVPQRVLADAPVTLMAYDLLEHAGQDIRAVPLDARRALLEDMLAPVPAEIPLRLSPRLPTADLAAARATARAAGAEGLMLKRRDSPYLAGRKRGDWWKWKVDPLTIDAVMIYAQQGHGRRATLFTDYTFAVRDGDTHVPFTKAYSGLTDAEFRQITTWVRANTQQRFGPVRQVPPVQVFEITFEGIAASPRHKSGVALRFPRMLRWRRDKPPAEIATLDDLREMLRLHG